jgi:hypothetical protein
LDIIAAEIAHPHHPQDQLNTEHSAMLAFDPAVVRDLTMLIIAITGLIKAIWPNGINR